MIDHATFTLNKDETFECYYCYKERFLGDQMVSTDSGETYCDVECMETDIQEILKEDKETDPENCNFVIIYDKDTNKTLGFTNNQQEADKFIEDLNKINSW